MRQLVSLIAVSSLLISCACTKKQAAENNLPTTSPISSTSINSGTVVDNKCPVDMVEVEGNYCPQVSQKCLEWLDKDQNPTANFGIGPLRCKEFEKPALCLSAKRNHLHFCMDKFEYPNIEGEYPIVGMNYYEAKNLASAAGKRLCTVEEFNFAGEGEDIRPYPYGDGYHRDCNVCNCDKEWKDFNKYPRSTWNDHNGGLNQGIKSDKNSQCRSIFGVINLAGNYDEILNSEHETNAILSGGYWGPVRARVRPKTTVHSKFHSFYQLTTRFCSDIKK